MDIILQAKQLLLQFSDWDWKAIARSAIEITLIYLVFYSILKFVQGTRGAGILRGLVFFLVIGSLVGLVLIEKLGLHEIHWLIRRFLPIFIIPVIILFQPELRRALIRIGHNPLFNLFFKGDAPIASEIIKATTTLSRNRVGGLIAIEREIGLGTYVEGGVKLDAEISSELISTIFWPGSPLHDGAIVIREQRITAAGCLFPLTDSPIVGKTMGTRHRAAIGLTEETDAVIIVVSGETGEITVAVRGQTTGNLNRDELGKMLDELAAEEAGGGGRKESSTRSRSGRLNGAKV